MHQLHKDEPPPIFGTWRRFYAAIVLYLLGVIALFTWFTSVWNR